jgi:hypothetical protein
VYSANFPSSNVMITPRLDRNASMMRGAALSSSIFWLSRSFLSSVGRKDYVQLLGTVHDFRDLRV